MPSIMQQVPRHLRVIFWLWLASFMLSIILFSVMEPTGDGFTRGANRGLVVMMLQLFSFAQMLAALVYAVRNRPKMTSLAWLIALMPLAAQLIVSYLRVRSIS